MRLSRRKRMGSASASNSCTNSNGFTVPLMRIIYALTDMIGQSYIRVSAYENADQWRIGPPFVAYSSVQPSQTPHAVHPAAVTGRFEVIVTTPTYNVLFLCTGNSARSIMAEAILNHKAEGRFMAYSAGSHPSGKVRRESLNQLELAGISTERLRSKSWDEFAASDAPQMHFIFTVCDNAANEVCPIWPGHPMTAHWGVPDPAAEHGTADEIARAFRDAFSILDRRISLFLALPFATLERLAIQQEIDSIGRR
jgi:arsenate reductase